MKIAVKVKKTSIIFATHNGARTLDRTLSSLCELSKPECELEIIIVDNNSTDSSQSIINSYQHKLPIKLLIERRQGKNYAINSAIKIAVGDLLLLTDDDIIADKNWLINMVNSVDKNPGFDLFGGKISPDWPDGAPDWLAHTTNIGMLYAVTPALDTGPVAAGAIWGPNMALRNSVLENTEAFNTNVGPDGSEAYVMGSETEMLNRLEKIGHRAWYVSDAIVLHQIRPNQLERKWALKRYYRHGRSSYAFDNTRNSCTSFIMGVERWLWKKYIFCFIDMYLLKPIQNKSQIIQAEEKWYFTKGQIYQSRLQSLNE